MMDNWQLLSYISYPLAAMMIPLVCFLIGVRTAVALNRYPDVTRTQIKWMSIPVCLLIVGANMSNASVTVDASTTFAYMQTPGKLLTAMGITVFYGVLTPSLFEAFLRRAQADAAQETAGAPQGG